MHQRRSDPAFGTIGGSLQIEPPTNRLPFVHLDPGSMSFLGLEPHTYHHSLKLTGFLPFLQLHGSKATPYPAVKVPEYTTERGRNNFRNYPSQLQATFARSQIPKTSK